MIPISSGFGNIVFNWFVPGSTAHSTEKDSKVVLSDGWFVRCMCVDIVFCLCVVMIRY